MAFGKRPGGLFGSRQPPTASAPAPSALPGSRRIASNLIGIGKGEADLAGGAARIVRFLLDSYNDEHGINAETVISAAGALAGFASRAQFGAIS